MIDPPRTALVHDCWATVERISVGAVFGSGAVVVLKRAVCTCGWKSPLTRYGYAKALIDCNQHVYGDDG